jgi:hypothetical protein
MTTVRWTAVVALGLLAIGPLLAVSSCGNNESNGNGGGDDATADGVSGDGSSFGDGPRDGGGGDHLTGDACSSTCPPGITCGHYTNPCTGVTIPCGSPCPKGQVCVGNGGNPPSQSCQAPACAGKCGVVGTDSCGVAVGCGGCEAGLDCINNQCLPGTVSDAAPSDGSTGVCAPLTCTPNQGTTLCGPITDGCGNIKQCPNCPSGQQCIGGVCGATPPECAATDAGPHCGTTANACGSGTVVCPGCTGSTTCQGGTCVGCTPPTCGSLSCGTLNNGCGGPVSCGTCSGGGEKCYDGGCCTPITCTEAAEAGIFTGCADVDLGCGEHGSCSTCGSGESCYDGGCCTPLSCAEAIDAGLVTGCGPVDLGCGLAKSCSSCGSGEQCYKNACCTPLTCAEAQDAGLVTGCGPVGVGCGAQKSCAPCAANQTCVKNACVNCTAKTCADFGNTGCGHADPCTGTTLDCCPTGTTCQGTICCPPGETAQGTICCPTGEVNANGICCPAGQVNYQGTCCLPKCDTSLPPGPQITCGLTIYCNGTQ